MRINLTQEQTKYIEALIQKRNKKFQERNKQLQEKKYRTSRKE